MKNIAIFCGSSDGASDHYRKGAFQLAQQLALQGWGLVYGGAQIGVMGSVADGFLNEEAPVTGVIPNFLGSKEIAHTGLTDLKFVKTMHERKQVMSEIADAFLTIPGGIGTLDEFIEILSWKQLKLHAKPIVLWNPNGFFNPLLEQLDLMVEKGFVRDEHLALFEVANSLEVLLNFLKKV